MNLKETIQRLLLFFKQDIWRVQVRKVSPNKSFFIHQLRIFILAGRGFVEDKIQLRASSLTFYSMLSVVPVLAMGFGIAKGFGFEKKLRDQILDNFSEQEVILNQVIKFAENLLDRTKGGYVAGVGLVVLFWSVMRILGHIENSFNDIWEIKRSRNFFRKFSDYLSLMIVAPIIILLSSSVTVYINTQVEDLAGAFPLFGYVSSFVLFLVKFIPYMLIWLLFAMVYIIMPNTKVNIKYGLIAGIIAGSLFQLLQWGYVNFQVGVSKYNAIYGSFAALPLFLLWLQFSWFIVLFGAEISFAYQNVENYEFESETANVSHHFKRIITILIAHHIIKNFETEKPPLTATEISHNLEMPIRLVRDVIFDLLASGIISETTTKSPKEMAYQPARDINKIDIKYMQEKLEKRGYDNISVLETPELIKISKMQENMLISIEKSPENILIKDI